MNEGFIPTNFDLWILLTRLSIPSLFISIKFIAETRFNKKEFVTYYKDNITKNMAVIIIPASFQRKRGIYPIYKLILNDSNDEKININIINSSDALSEALSKKITIDDYLDKFFIKDNKTKHKKRKPGKRAFDELLERNIRQQDISKKDNYNISFKPGERDKKIKEMEINEPLETQKQKDVYIASDESDNNSISDVGSVRELETNEYSGNIVFDDDIDDKKNNNNDSNNDSDEMTFEFEIVKQPRKKQNVTTKKIREVDKKTNNKKTRKL